MAKVQHESGYTRAVMELINKIENSSEQMDSLVQDAALYFETAAFQKNKLTTIKARYAEKNNELANSGKKAAETISTELQNIEQSLKNETSTQEEERQARLEKVIAVCDEILSLSEGKDAEETLDKSAKFLGTVLLLSPMEGKRLPEVHQRLKPAYKAVLSVRLLDELMNEQSVKNQYLVKHYDSEKRFKDDEQDVQLSTVIYPIMFAAMFQDIGMQHPDAQKILKGSDKKLDPYRVLDPEDRKEMLKLTYQHTLDYIENGLGMRKYIGNSREERDVFMKEQTNALSFIKLILRDIVKPQHGLGEIIKIPQIYASVVLSTKRDYRAAELPKGCILIEQLAEKGSINKVVAKYFTRLVGHFPQGYGITYIPLSDQGEELDRYEYAIVSSLKPDDPFEPSCRVVTRNLTYIASGPNMTIKRGVNLFFPKARKKLAKVDKEKLIKILEKLKHEFNEEHIENLIPPCWLPHDYFSLKKNQNLWSKAY
ncbi:hypothetical protein [Alteromonas facilis]|uniref:hypothetical protein n=1 Tax=Alteromonas facilis TaxID=2048004 RepID=UPI000C2957EC|nr:hypothetical protein [Alteromonas facilis]